MVTGKIAEWFRGRRKLASGAMLVLAVVLIFGAVYSPQVVGVAATERELPIYCVQRDQKVVALSFDAAWGDGSVRQ